MKYFLAILFFLSIAAPLYAAEESTTGGSGKETTTIPDNQEDASGKKEEEKEPDEAVLRERDKIVLPLVLADFIEGGGYKIVAPETNNYRLKPERFDDDFKKRMLADLQVEGEDVSGLLDKLVKRNSEQVKLNIPSSEKDGYLIDYERKFDKYFERSGGGWTRLYKENPKAYGFVNISLPSYDEKTGLVLIYKGVENDNLAGAGFLYLYRCQNGKLTQLRRAIMWIS